jgi:virginiamycin B lyase
LASKRGSSGSKKIALYAIIGIIAVAVVSVSLFARGGSNNNNSLQQNVQNSQEESLKKFQAQFCGVNPQANSTSYIREFVLPSECEMPLGLTIDDGRVWYVSTKQGIFGSFSIADSKFEERQIPSWPSRSNPTAQPSMSWSVRSDGAGNIWFTDQAQNAIWRFNKSTETFDMFITPARYPASFDFDSNGNLYLTGIQSHSLYFGEVSKMKNGTSEGFTEITLPLDGFAGIDPDLITSGSLVVDNDRKDVWMPVLAFEQKGQIFRYDIDTKKVDLVVDLPDDLRSPVGAAIDSSGNLWITDHATSTFFKYDSVSGEFVKFVTGTTSPKIYGGTTPPNAYALPYWIDKAPDGSLWFNEHTGNKIARFDPDNLALKEYWIPSQNRLWALCPDGAQPCGLANALQFAIGPDNQVWFTEWTENKIGSVNTQQQVPISVSLDKEELSVQRGNAVEIKVSINATDRFEGSMMAAGTFAPNGGIINATGTFSQESVSLDAGGQKQISYVFTPSDSLKAGRYVIMLGAGNDEISYQMAIKVTVI